ncbi:unnamed protein product [Clavelina lepadiformis]|uniref:G-protein coupled receptors family 1 profile domain-containing protein n=1 Tax=Clavelina lepadiformis TaxID=159417 RepID=A0ABP0GV89_CLALP
MTTANITEMMTWQNLTTSLSDQCQHHQNVIKENGLTFDTLHLVRVVVTWILFAVSLAGNVFILLSLKGKRSQNFVMLNLTLSDLFYTAFVMPIDAFWNTFMEWMAGDVMCRVCQMVKQFGMYSSSFMVMVIALDRVTGVIASNQCSNQKKKGVILVACAWTASLLCSLPAGVIFSVISVPTCEGVEINQCVDFLVVPRVYLRPYYFFTMLMSFLLPQVVTLLAYSLIACEISNMKKRDCAMMGRKNSVSSMLMQKAKRRTLIASSLITLAFLVCWGPYYGRGIYDWFQADETQRSPAELSTVMYIAIYLNPVLHPIVFGIFMKEIKSKLFKTFGCSEPRQIGRFHVNKKRISLKSNMLLLPPVTRTPSERNV